VCGKIALSAAFCLGWRLAFVAESKVLWIALPDGIFPFTSRGINLQRGKSNIELTLNVYTQWSLQSQAQQAGTYPWIGSDFAMSRLAPCASYIAIDRKKFIYNQCQPAVTLMR